MTTTPHAVQAGAGTPESDKARGANAGQVEEQVQKASPDFHATGVADQASITAGDRLLDVACILGGITLAELEALGIELDPGEAQRVATELRRIGFHYVQRVAVETEVRLALELRTAQVDKRFTTAQARMARAGGVLNVIEGDRGQLVYIATRGCWAKELEALADVKAWLDRMEPASCPR